MGKQVYRGASILKSCISVGFNHVIKIGVTLKKGKLSEIFPLEASAAKSWENSISFRYGPSEDFF